MNPQAEHHSFTGATGSTWGHEAVAVDASGERRRRAVDPNRILIVDDEPEVRRVMCRLIQHLTDGVETEVATNGSEAVQKFMQGWHGVILTDLDMPGMNGYDGYMAMQRLHKAGACTMPRVVFCCGNPPPNFLEHIPEDERPEMLLKPLDMERLRDLIGSEPRP